ncbi:hypothetical protein O181_005265 [Austropuccinia psidii MF-1]|uniref:Uncharacterized protein n=1 Tax=Austropuccinia psidii MF-1 TaxID=1389203 RepID=A0A9Q3GFN7_9BASI|nr:hypothetical protein [Austropuccinia psidii MF-1]
MRTTRPERTSQCKIKLNTRKKGQCNMTNRALLVLENAEACIYRDSDASFHPQGLIYIHMEGLNANPYTNNAAH